MMKIHYNKFLFWTIIQREILSIFFQKLGSKEIIYRIS